MDAPDYSQSQLRQIHQHVRAWYSKHQRDLPWRLTNDPYRIWLSEIMLQQTTVTAVIPYFERFLDRFPTLAELAAAQQDEVLRFWEGLGYYSRARNIHRTAQILIADHAGRFPQTVAELQGLPGIGRYTAGAIASFAFDIAAPILEANTIRLYARLIGWDADLKTSASQKRLWQVAEQLVPDKHAGQFNQAIMDLGSQVCTPVKPNCQICPLSAHCAAFASGRQAEIPRPKVRQPPTPLTHLCVVVNRSDQTLLQQYADGERWAGLWDFPRWQTEQELPDWIRSPKSTSRSRSLFAATEQTEHHDLFRTIEQEFAERFGQKIQIQDHITTIRHAVTRYSITLVCLQARTRAKTFRLNLNQPQWFAADELAQLPLSKTGRQIAELIR